MIQQSLSPKNPSPLALTRALLRALVYVNLVAGALIGALLIASLVWTSTVVQGLGVRPGPDRAALVFGMRTIMVVGILAVPLMHLILIRLLAFLDTVAAGMPFQSANAVRLKTVAWAVVGLECLHVVVGIVAARASSPAQPLDIGWNLPVTRVLTILLLFVLAGVFDEGARMHDELSATV